jgi:hypothetical protein
VTGAGVTRVERGRTEGSRVRRTSEDIFGVLTGTEIYAPVDVPINLCGNPLSMVGLAQSLAAWITSIDVPGEADGAAVKNQSGRGLDLSPDSPGDVDILPGRQLAAPISIPINVCGNSLAVLAAANPAACADDVDGDRGNGHSVHAGGRNLLDQLGA